MSYLDIVLSVVLAYKDYIQVDFSQLQQMFH